MSRVAEIRRLISRADATTPFPFKFVDVPTAPGHNHLGLNGSMPRHEVAKMEAGLGYSESHLFGNPEFPRGSTPVTPIYEINDTVRNSASDHTITTRISAFQQLSPYARKAFLLAATDRPKPSRSELEVIGDTPVLTRLAATLRERARKGYTTMQLSGLQAAHEFRGEDPEEEKGYPFVMENQLVHATTEDEPTPRTVADIHSHVGRYDTFDLRDRNEEDFPALLAEKAALTPEVTAWMSLLTHAFIRTFLIEQHFPQEQIERINIVPGIGRPAGMRIRYEGVGVESLTAPDNIDLIAAVDSILFVAYISALHGVDEQLPTLLEHEGQIFPRVPDLGFRQISYVDRETDKFVQAVNPVLVPQSHGAPNAGGMRANRAEDIELSEEQEKEDASFRSYAGDRIETTMHELGFAA